MKNIKIIIVFIVYFFAAENIIAQQPQTEWIQRYNSSGNYNEDLVDMVLDKYGNIYLTGNTGNPSDIITLKYSSQGNLLWARTYNGPTNREDEAVKIAVDDSGFVYVEGMTFRPIEFTNYLTIKYSSAGDVVWIREFNHGDSTTEVPRDMVIDYFSNIFITGDGGICGLCPSDYLTVKYDRNGNLKWFKRYHGEGYFSNLGWTLALDNSGRAIVSGRSADINNRYYNATVIYNSFGDTIRVIKIDSAEVRRLDTDNFSNFYIAGIKSSAEPPINSDIFLNKYDSSGILIWKIMYGSNSSLINRNDYLSWMHLDMNERNIYLTSLSDINNQNGWDFLLLKYNTSGDSLWKRDFAPVNNSDNQSIQLTVDRFNNIYITGSSDYNTPFYRFLTVKYDSAGNFKWSMNYTNYLFANHYAKRVLIDSSNSVYVAGTSYSNTNGTNDITLIKYSQITSINQFPHEYLDFKLNQNYPNPFNPVTVISYELKYKSEVKIKIYDVLGKEVVELVNKIQETGKHEITFDGSNFPNGVYFYNLEINGSIFDTKKLLLIK